MPYTWKDTARLIGGTKVAKRVTKQKNTTDDMESGNRNTPVTTPPAKTTVPEPVENRNNDLLDKFTLKPHNKVSTPQEKNHDIIDMSDIFPGLKGLAPQNEQEIEIEDDTFINEEKRVPLKIVNIGRTLGDIRSLDGGRRMSMTIGDRNYEFHTDDIYGSYKSLSLDRNDKPKSNFYVYGDYNNSIGLESLSGDSKIDLMLYTALGERGTKEDGTNGTKYGDWYYGGEVSGVKFPWCATFVSWAADQAGLVSSNETELDSVIPKYQGCVKGQELYSSKGRLHVVGDKNDDYKPKAGDVFFKNNGAPVNGNDHTGIVLAYDEKNDYIYTIEGNSENSVQVLKRPRSSIYSFGSNGGTKNGIIPKNIDTSNGRTQ